MFDLAIRSPPDRMFPLFGFPDEPFTSMAAAEVGVITASGGVVVGGGGGDRDVRWAMGGTRGSLQQQEEEKKRGRSGV